MTSTTSISTNEEKTLRQAIDEIKNEMPAIQARADHLEDLLGMVEAEANSAAPDTDLIEEHVQTVEEQAEDLNERVVALNEALTDILGDEATEDFGSIDENIDVLERATRSPEETLVRDERHARAILGATPRA